MTAPQGPHRYGQQPGWSGHPSPVAPYLPPPSRRNTPLVVTLVVAAVVAIAAVVTVVVVTSGGSTTAGGSGGPGGLAPVAVTSRQTSAGRSVAPSRQDPPPGVLSGDDGNGGAGNGDTGTAGNGTGDDGTGGNGDTGNAGTGDDGDTGSGGEVNGNPGNGNAGNGAASGTQQDAILQSAMAWIDARNAGDGDRTLQLGCSDDIAAVQGGQPNPAAYAGYTAFRPTGQLVPHGSGTVAAYVVISSQDLRTGSTQPSRLPIIKENGQWRMCYYPGEAANRIATGG